LAALEADASVPARGYDRVSWLTEADHAVLALFVCETQFLLEWLYLKLFIAETSVTLRIMHFLLHDEHGRASICIFLGIQSSLRHNTFDFESITLIILLLFVFHPAYVVSVRHLYEVLLVLSHLRIPYRPLHLLDLPQHLLILTVILTIVIAIIVTPATPLRSISRLQCRPELAVFLVSEALQGGEDELRGGVLLVELEEAPEGRGVLGVHEGLQPVPTQTVNIDKYLLEGGVEDKGCQKESCEVEDQEDASICQQIVVRVRGLKGLLLIRQLVSDDDF
jgi:hypothetical protein